MSWQDTVSAWNWRKGRWDHYRRPPWSRPGWGDLPQPAKPGGKSQALGETPEESALPFPPGATYIGSSDQAEGQVVQAPGSRLITALAIGAVGYLVYRVWRSR